MFHNSQTCDDNLLIKLITAIDRYHNIDLSHHCQLTTTQLRGELIECSANTLIS